MPGLNIRAERIRVLGVYAGEDYRVVRVGDFGWWTAAYTTHQHSQPGVTAPRTAPGADYSYAD